MATLQAIADAILVLTRSLDASIAVPSDCGIFRLIGPGHSGWKAANSDRDALVNWSGRRATSLPVDHRLNSGKPLDTQNVSLRGGTDLAGQRRLLSQRTGFAMLASHRDNSYRTTACLSTAPAARATARNMRGVLGLMD